jgi:hypothetical protein
MTEGNNNKKKRKKIILPPIKNNNINDKEINKNNHALKFDNYTKRVFSVKQTNDKISYLEPYNYLKNSDKSIDFKKIPSRKENSLINSSLLETPNFCYYHPNYDIIYKSPIKFSFKYDEKKKLNKKFMMRKLLSSFKCEPGYHIIDVKKFGIFFMSYGISKNNFIVSDIAFPVEYFSPLKYLYTIRDINICPHLIIHPHPESLVIVILRRVFIGYIFFR